MSDFDVLVFDPILSDIHCPVYAAFTIETINKQNAINDKDHFLINKPKTKFIWKSEDAALYKDKLSEVDCSYIEDKLNLLKNSCKIYKRNINKAYRDYENELIKKIRKLQSENPREYWKLIQGKRGPNSIPNISLEIFENILKT